jgi:hypothetical protein
MQLHINHVSRETLFQDLTFMLSALSEIVEIEKQVCKGLMKPSVNSLAFKLGIHPLVVVLVLLR